MTIRERLPHQWRIPQWLVNDLNRSYITYDRAHRVYWEDVEAYPEIIVTREDLTKMNGAGHDAVTLRKWLRKNRWQGCLRMYPFQHFKNPLFGYNVPGVPVSRWSLDEFEGLGKYRRCNHPLWKDSFCHFHYPKAVIDGKVSTPSVWQRIKEQLIGRRRTR